jgi:hypothetical protein
MNRKLASTRLGLRIRLLAIALGPLSCSTSGGTGDDGSAGRVGSGGSRGVGGTGGSAIDGGVDASDDKPPTVGAPCESNAECGPTSSLFLVCQAPGEFLGCGACRVGMDLCANDGDCARDASVAAGPQICDPAPSTSCFCSGTHVCRSGCRTSDVCGAGEGCNPTNHYCEKTCVPGDGTCSADYACDGTGFCAQTACTVDSQCSGACVKGRCYAGRGACQSRPA